jgi:hypothetical protein
VLDYEGSSAASRTASIVKTTRFTTFAVQRAPAEIPNNRQPGAHQSRRPGGIVTQKKSRPQGRRHVVGMFLRALHKALAQVKPTRPWPGLGSGMDHAGQRPR